MSSPESTAVAETCPAELPNFCAQRHWSIFWILIVCSTVIVAGRIANVQNHNARGDTPFFSANDRSRWCTIRSLVDEGTYEIDEVIQKGQPLHWDTIDKVRHIGADGEMHFYSSKPTLLPSLMAGGYFVVKSVTGMSLADDTLPVARILLLLFNALPWAIFLYFVARTINAIPVRDWTRYFVLACAGFGTYLSTFAITLNNHLPAAICVMIALDAMLTIQRRETTGWGAYFVAGLFAAFAAANELPALSFFALGGLYCFVKSPAKTLTAYLAGGLLVGAGFFGTNFLAHGEWKPAYAHRSDGAVLVSVTGDFESDLNRGSLPKEFRDAAKSAGVPFQAPSVGIGAWPTAERGINRWVVRDVTSTNQVAITSEQGSGSFEIRGWNNWYDYPGSYWLTENDSKKSMVDRGQESLPVYIFHVMFGHHGIFSLTPIWLLSIPGMIVLMLGFKFAGRFQMRAFGLMAFVITVVVVGFYLSRPAMDRNYGGITCALRWLFWLAPIWLVSMLPVVDWLAGSKSGRCVCFVLLILSALSALIAMDNPWVHPWLYDIWEMTGLPK